MSVHTYISKEKKTVKEYGLECVEGYLSQSEKENDDAVRSSIVF